MDHEHYENLLTAIRSAFARFQELRLTVVEDTPAGDGAILVERSGDRIDDIVGWLAESADAVAEAIFKRETAQERDCLRNALAFSDTQAIKVSAAFSRDLVSYSAIRELRRLGKKRGPEWALWAYSVEQALDGCRAPVEAVQRALVAAWKELAREVGAGVVVTNTNVGFTTGSPAGAN
jgi:hypothetical protein